MSARMLNRSSSAFGVALAILAVGMPISTNASQRFSQLSFSFPNKRVFDHQYDQASNTLTLQFRNTTPQELVSLDHYDETLIRRILVKDQSPVATEVSISLRDRDVRVSISEVDEPYRVLVDLFDRDFRQPRDPETGLPIVAITPQSSNDIKQEAPVSPATDSTPLVAEAPLTSKPAPRKLMQPTPLLVNTPSELNNALDEVDPGIGKRWKDYPIYIYRLQTASLINEKERATNEKEHQLKALSSTQAMADYAGRLFDFGHENRALLAYQQVLHKQPSIFDNDPLHLWKFAESHMGQANLTLADGYFQGLIEKHPESELSEFAKIRRLDIEAINLSNAGKTAEFSELLNGLKAIQPRKSTELLAQVAIRESFWQAYASAKDPTVLGQRDLIPEVGAEMVARLSSMTEQIESQRTSFIAATIVLNSMLSSKQEWTKETGIFASSYFDRFSGSATEPFRKQLREKTDQRLLESFKDRLDKGRYVELVSDFDSLSKSLQTIENNPIIAWEIAESLRRLGQTERSLRFYELAGKNATNPSDRFRAHFWLAMVAGSVRQQLKSGSENPARVALTGDLTRSADRSMEASWSDLKEEQKSSMISSFGENLEKNIDSDIPLKAPASIILGEYTKKLSTRVAPNSVASSAAANQAAYSPNARTIYLLSRLAKRFGELGMPQQRQEALSLLQFMKPNDVKDDASARKLWASELSTLAEEYRQQNRGMDAGRLFAFTGSNAEDYEDRAEALYKGGLLLYRSGRRDEAITAFKTCSEDGNNRYYANLCLERLDKLNNQ